MARRELLAALVIVGAALVPATPGHAVAACSAHNAARRRTALSGGRDAETLGRGAAAALERQLREALLKRFGTTTPRVPATVSVPVEVHVITAGTLGRLSRAVVDSQLATMNNAYDGDTGGADTGVSFRLARLDYTDNPLWFDHPQQYEKALKTQLRHGGPGTLNLYTAAVGTDVLGFSTFPQWYRKHPVLDGVVVDYRSVPGGEYVDFNKGYTAVHETGHWLGLFHTFENGCDAPGDSVADTPYEATPTDGCPWYKDTCWAAGDDPVHNFMDYGYDTCMTEFTPGQGRRIRTVWAAFRAG